jgi:inner membrane protein
MFLAHAPISYLANESIQKNKISGLKNSQQIFVAVLSLVFGILPDLDFLVLMTMDRPSYTHHDFFTHTPFYWICLWLLLVIFLKVIYPQINRKTKQFLTKDLLDILLNAFLIAGLSHFLADLLVGNIMLLYPFSNTPMTILRYVFEPSYFTGYFVSVYFAIEIIIVAVFFLVFSRKFLKKHKWDDVVAYTLLAFASIYLAFSAFMNFQTYNNSFLEASNKPYRDYDIDYDTLRDTQDWDVDNDGIDNILDADYDQVVENAENILDSHKLAVGEIEGIKDKLFLKYGALDSYRLISQAFYEDYSPIEPVLKDHYLKSLEQKRYTVSFQEDRVLKDFLSSKDLLLNLNYQGRPLLATGKIFFLLEQDGNILNMGITLEGNQLAIVLPGEKHIQKHSLDGILRFYGDTISTFQILR